MVYAVSEVSRFTHLIFPEEHAPAGVCRYGSSVEYWLPKPKRRVRLPLSAFRFFHLLEFFMACVFGHMSFLFILFDFCIY